MQRAVDADDFLRDPVGRCFVGGCFLVWCHSPTLCGSTIWGAPTEHDASEAARVSDFLLHPSMAPKCDVLMDYRAVERLDPEVLIRYGELVSAHLVAWGPRVDRLVAILPGGLPGILIAGAVPSLQPAFSEALNRPIRFLSDAESALAYLDRADAREALDETQQMIAESRGKAALIDRLRAQLAREPADASLQGIARVLGTSPRSLQRELRLLGTSFSDELRRVRVSTAADLLLHSDGKIDAIAVRVGLGTASRMSAVFRREVGLTPTELRARRR